MIKFTVVTVCRNAERTIAQTMDSVLAQDHRDIEYLIIDGQSEDGTVDIAEKIRQKNRHRDVQIYSEKDHGIYNAMNRGITRATGDHVIFLNAGDTFWDDKVLARASRIIEKKGYGLYYGVAYKIRDGRMIGTIDYGNDKRPHLIKLLGGLAPNHQATFAPLSCLKKFYFDERYGYCADLDWFIRCYKSGMRLIDMAYPVCRFDMSGVSSSARAVTKGREDIYKVLKRQFPILGRLAVSSLELR